jgi:hypothetical protein
LTNKGDRLVESEKAGVGGSIPSQTTIILRRLRLLDRDSFLPVKANNMGEGYAHRAGVPRKMLYNKDLPGSNVLPCSQFVTDHDQDCGLQI